VAIQRPVYPRSQPRLLDLRVHRLAVPLCTSCGSDRTAVVSRTPYVVYVRCSYCGAVCSLPMPGRVPLGS
jgi:hypothetical protein